MKKDSQIEIEALGFIDKKEFIKLKKIYSIKYGNPERKNRLAISIWNPRVNKNTDTRIRITNGKAEIMQKNGDWENRVDMKLEELSIKLKNLVDDILSAYKILMNVIKSDYPARIIQHESYIFYTKRCEIKLVKQFGKEDKYLFEVELSSNSDDL